MSLMQLKKKVSSLASMERAKSNEWFFKTGKGEYGEGDVFLGLTMPEMRKIAKQFCALSFQNIETLLKNKFHEYRMIGLLILINKYELGDTKEREKIFRFYIKNRKAVNNWDLVDVSTPHIIGNHLLQLPVARRKFLYTYAKSQSLWERRIAILATFPFIKLGKFTDTLKISKLLLNDTEDLIHKAVGWMLREVGKHDKKTLVTFLNKNIRETPRTTLRYAIERFPEKERKAFLKK